MSDRCTPGSRRVRRAGLAVGLTAVTLLAAPTAGSAAADPGTSTAPGRETVASALPGGGRVEVLPGDGAGPASVRVTPSAPGVPVKPYAFAQRGDRLTVQPAGRTAPVTLTAPALSRAASSAKTARPGSATHPVTFTVPPVPNAESKYLFVWNRADWAWGTPIDDPDHSRYGSANLPTGDYFAVALLPAFEGSTMSLLATPFTVTRAGARVVFSSRTVETRITVDDPTARREDSVVWISVPGGDLAGFAGGGPDVQVRVTPFTVPGVTLRLHEVLVPADGTPGAPYRYDLFHEFAGRVPADPVVRVATAGLARTVTTVRAQGGEQTTGALVTMPVTNERAGVPLDSAITVPGSVTEYVTPGAAFDRSVDVGDDWRTFDLGVRTLTAGANPAETAGVAPLAPRRSEWSSATRHGDTVEVREHAGFDDAAGNLGSNAGTVLSARLTSAGRTLADVTATAPDEPVRAVVDPEPATYELTHVLNRQVPWSRLSTEVRNEWVFSSRFSSWSENLPLVEIDLGTSGLDASNAAGAAPVEVSVAARTRSTGVDTVVTDLEFSIDDGVTWQHLPMSGSTAELKVPASAAFVSLRATATNEDGGSLRRTIVRAFAGPAR